MLYRAIPVEEILTPPLDESGATKIAILRGMWSTLSTDAAWCADQVANQFRAASANNIVRMIPVADFSIVQNASSNPNDRAFAAGDQFPMVYEPLEQADVIVICCSDTYGLPDSNVVRVMERFRVRYQDKDTGKLPLLGKCGGVVVVGGPGSFQAASDIARAMTCLGINVAGRAVISWDSVHNDPRKDMKFSKRVEDLPNLLRNSRR